MQATISASSRASTRAQQQPSPRTASSLDDMPDVPELVAHHVASLLVDRVVVERLALEGPLLAAVVARDDREVAFRPSACRGHRRRPQRRARAVAGALAADRPDTFD